MKILKWSLRILRFLILSLLIGYGIFIANAKYVLHEQLPMLGGYGTAIVLSGSMQPEIEVDDLLFIKKCDSYEVNDVVTFVDTDLSLVTHRIVSYDPETDTFTTKGDANNTPDRTPLDPERIKGRVVGKISKFGRFFSLFQNPLFILLLVAIGIFLTEWSYRREKKSKSGSADKIRAEIESLRLQMQQEDTDIDTSEKPEAHDSEPPVTETEDEDASSDKTIPDEDTALDNSGTDSE